MASSKFIHGFIMEFVAMEEFPFKPKELRHWLSLRLQRPMAESTVYSAIQTLHKRGVIQKLGGGYYANRRWRAPFVARQKRKAR